MLTPSRRDLFANAATALAGVGLAHLLAPPARAAGSRAGDRLRI